MRKLSLFSGIGGIDLAAHWAGMETVAFCEREPFPQRVLQKNFPGVPIYDDVCTLTKERLEQDGIIGPDRAIDIISAGYPCQPFSSAGQRRGTEDDRHLWPEVARLLCEIRPRWFVGENVAGHIALGLDDVLDDLERLDYSAQTFIVPAGAVGAQHVRERIFIVSHTNGERLQRGQVSRGSSKVWKRAEEQFSRLLPPSAWTKVSATSFSGRTDGVSKRMDADRVKGLGNAVAPHQIFPFLAAIKAIHDQL